jgi:hypothetical protein
LLYALIAFLWVGANLTILAVAPQWAEWAMRIQVGLVVLFVLVGFLSGTRASSE